MKTSRRRFIQWSGAACLGLPSLASLPAFGAAVSAKKAGGAPDPRPSLPTVNGEIRASAASARLSMLFDGRTSEDLAVWQKRFSEKVLALIGPHTPPAKWAVKTLATATFPDFAREELLLSANGVPSLPFYLLRPRSAGAQKFPILLCLHGHGAGAHDCVVGRDDTPELAAEIRKYNYDYGRQLVREGYMIVAPCFTPFGRRLDESLRTARGDPCAMTYVRLMVLGRTIVGENLRDAKWALDYAAGRPDAQADRIGCVGLSLGGRMTAIVSAFEPRIRVAVISGSQNVFQERLTKDAYCGSQVIPHITEYGDVPEIGSLIAPRPAIWETGDEDASMDPAWKEVARKRIQRAYDAAGQPGAVGFDTFKGGHRWYGTTGVPLLARHLKAPSKAG